MRDEAGLDGVAVVGMAAVFPGAASAGQFWENVLAGVEALSPVPAARLGPGLGAVSSGTDPLVARRGGFVDDLAVLDPVALGVMPAAIDTMEPDQLLTLALCVDALVDAGLEDLARAQGPPGRRERTGVIVGRGGYLTPGLARLDQAVRTGPQLAGLLAVLQDHLEPATARWAHEALGRALAAPGGDGSADLVPSFAASRVANRLDLAGPAYTVDGACASSLLALDHACRELRSGRCDLVLAGGVHLCHDVTLWHVFESLGALSPSGRLMPFQRAADGLVVGEGGAMVVLQRLADAQAEDRRIYAVIRGVGVGSDGRGASLVRPSVAGQVRTVRQAWREARCDPGTVGLLEAHGTATPAGDAAELATIGQVFGDAPGRRAPGVPLGAVKAMIGHTMAAAGMAGFLSAARALHDGVLPPARWSQDPVPALGAAGVFLLGEPAEWPSGETPRRAGVSAFGFGGVNAHVVLQEPPGIRSPARRLWGSARSGGARQPPEPLLLLGAPDRAGLLAALEAAAAGGPESGRSAPPRAPERLRLALFAPSEERLGLARRVVDRLHPWRGRSDLWFTGAGLAGGGGKVAFVYPGVEPRFFPRLEDVGVRLGMQAPGPLGLDDGAASLENVGRGLIAASRLLTEALAALGIHPDVVAGQSIGEWSGMIASEMIPPGEVDEFVASVTPGALEVPGVAFVALGCDAAGAARLCAGEAGLVVSHENCPHQTIVCGPLGPVRAVIARARADRVMAQELPFRSGFHTPLFAPFLGPFQAALARLPLQEPRFPLWSATTGAPYPDDPAEIRALAAAHLVRPVRFRGLTEALYGAGVRIFVQAGVGSLPGLIEDTLAGQEVLAIGANSPRRTGVAQLARVAAALWVEGVEGIGLDRLGAARWERSAPELPIRAAAPRRRLPLATPFVRLPAPPVPAGAAPGAPAAPEVPAARPRLEGPLGEELGLLWDQVARSATVLARALPGHPGTPGRSITKVVSVAQEPALADHCFFRQPPCWPHLSDRFPVVPMTAMIQMMIDAVVAGHPGLVCVRVEGVRARRWLAAAPPTEVALSVHEERRGDLAAGERAVRVAIEGYAGCRVVVAPSYPSAPAPQAPPVSLPHDPTVAPSQLYEDRWMFHGPAYQGIVALGPMGPDGIDGVVEVPKGPGALLDNAGQLMGYWAMARARRDRLALPTGVRTIELFGPEPAPGAQVAVSVRTREHEGSVRAEMELVESGRLWARVRGWEDRRFESDDALWEVLVWPELSVLSEEAHGYVWAREHWRSAASRELMMRRYLGDAERKDYERRPAHARPAFLLGRIAVKDAVRLALWRRGAGPLWPAQVAVVNDESGQPVLTAPEGAGLAISLAHAGAVAVAAVGEGCRVGIDVEVVAPRPAGFSALAFSPVELAIVAAASGDQDLALTKAWAAKEALAKARGTGLRGRLRDLEVSAMSATDVEVDGVPVWTETRDGMVVATVRIAQSSPEVL